MDIYKLLFAYGLLIHMLKTYAPDGINYTPQDAENAGGYDIDVEYLDEDEDGVPAKIAITLVAIEDPIESIVQGLEDVNEKIGELRESLTEGS